MIDKLLISIYRGKYQKNEPFCGRLLFLLVSGGELQRVSQNLKVLILQILLGKW
jgi:hypothetical protein